MVTGRTDIETFVPQLPSAPGWAALADRDREWLTQHTSNAITSFRESGFKAIQSCAELALIQAFLEGKSMTFTSWVRTCFGSSERTAYRWLAAYKELRGSAADEAILFLAQEGIAGVNSSLQPREIAPVLKALPPPRDLSNRKSLEAWSHKVGEELRSRRSRRRTRVPLRLDQEDALRVFVLTTDRLLRESRLATSAEQRRWLGRGLGYVLEKRAIPGTVSAQRLSIPEGFLPKRGRPRKAAPGAGK